MFEFVDTEESIKNPRKAFAFHQMVALKGPTTFELAKGECLTTVITGANSAESAGTK